MCIMRVSKCLLPLFFLITFSIVLVSCSVEQDALVGAWVLEPAQSDCGFREVLRFTSDGTVFYSDDQGNRAQGRYGLSKRIFYPVSIEIAGGEVEDMGDCGWKEGERIEAFIEIDPTGRSWNFFDAPERPWVRRSDAPSGDGTEKDPAAALHEGR